MLILKLHDDFNSPRTEKNKPETRLSLLSPQSSGIVSHAPSGLKKNVPHERPYVDFGRSCTCIKISRHGSAVLKHYRKVDCRDISGSGLGSAESRGEGEGAWSGRHEGAVSEKGKAVSRKQNNCYSPS